MSAYFRMSDAIFDCAPCVELARTAKGDSGAPARVMLFVKILCWALNPSKCLRDASALADAGGVSARTAERVWEVCIEHGVLRPAGYGYTARAWLVDNGFLGKYEKNASVDAVFSEAMRDYDGI